MTTAPTNEMLALADDLIQQAKNRTDHFRPKTYKVTLEYRAAQELRRLAATSSARDVREALEPFIKAAHIIEKRPQDYGNKRIAAFGGLADAHDLYPNHFLALLPVLSNLDAAAPAAGGDKPDAWVVQLKYGPDHWSGDMLTDVLPSDTETYRIIRQLYAAPPLQAPADSDAVREALAEAHKSFETIRLVHPGCAQTQIDPAEPASIEDIAIRLVTPKTKTELPCPSWLHEWFTEDEGFRDWLMTEAVDQDDCAREEAADCRREMQREVQQ